MAPVDTPVDDVPRVTPALLRWADSMCGRRLAGMHHDRRGNRPSDARFRVANRVFDSARLAHLDVAVPSLDAFRATAGLEPEEQRVYDAAGRWYVALFGDRAVRAVDLDDWESPVVELGVRLVGPAGLPVVDAEGRRELRLLRVGRRPVAGDPLESVDARFALERVAEWAGGGSLLLGIADLVHGVLVEQEVDVDRVLESDVRPWLAERVGVIRARAVDPAPAPGLECANCRYVAGCGAHA
ncbi:MAG TPA: hypothetical protein VMQ81_13855 [Acidimicrobiia bacterium]|nr:hypothetical protein [Acidimicrobiia bacterium]